MLTRIKSAIFAEGTIDFHEGLNVVLGDNKGSNSIGKSTLLMIIDFVYGGNTYISHNSDVVANLGHHEFGFTFEFNKTKYHYVRGTENSEVVYESNNKYERLVGISVDDFTKQLKNFYELESEQLSFRSAVSNYSRVWGKENNNVKKPLHSFAQEKFTQTVTSLIKLFNEYDAIELQDKAVKNLEDQRKVLNKAGKHKLIPKINKTKLKKNLKEIEALTKEIERIGKSAYSGSGDISEIVSGEMITIREKKKKLIDEKEYYVSRLNRTNKTIEKSSVAGFESLLEFFPNVNVDKLHNIESFHQGISFILTDELENAKKELADKINELNKEIDKVVKKQDQLLKPDEELTVFIDSLIEMSSMLKNLQLENDYYNKLAVIKEDIKTKKSELEELKEKIVERISRAINKKLTEINDLIHEDKRTAPKLNLSYNKYDYEVFDNTGTGKAYANLIIFDLAILTLTKMPFIMHDSFLFKNIENEAVEHIIKFYNSISKQVFVAIDNTDMYNKETQKILEEKKVIQLSNEKLLTTKDWGDKSKKETE
ncbi:MULTISPECIES: DUF2326 domain-containing protein [Bacillus]|uniref:DUF2326 domain-containing protein n=1 Tax=Bacillus pumilus TaxID=1408 RepID=A0AB34R0A5_BACPU|nr:MULTISPECIES: DUF2326 domain-containing protein [Bacillus]KIL20597.1 hypothetical protein B4127_2881 [Bacillus pumilus]MBU8575938.1 DUF2326 domain-containing protein [Bacillus pumilus]OBS84932.1 hypothetical protein BAY68_09370 [Bacillus pumilus]PRR93426.1 DUF2326 domain-containing protein [Bacillus sp. NMCN1]PRS00978.1 DUF2326 domain-containing protein [Bacillus sp. NMCN6]